MTMKCNACGMPMTNPADHANNDTATAYCTHCARSDGSMKSYDEVLDGMTTFMVRTQGIDEAAARQMAGQAMKNLPAWSDR